jgi:hypothetical protein
MRSATLLLCTVLGSRALGACPPDCVGGGGPAATDCFVAWSAPGTVTCVDGEACDLDGAADGVCTFGLQACINVPGISPCTPSTLDGAPTVAPTRDPLASQLTSALAALDPAAQACTTSPLTLPLKVSLAGIRRGVSRAKVTAVSGGKRDRDKLKLTCQPSTAAPSFAGDVQPIFSARCAVPTCHTGPSAQSALTLDAGTAYAQIVNVRSTEVRLMRVKPRTIRGSFLARKILGQGILSGSRMPFICPGAPPASGCLTDAEIFTILSWIANGAPDN